MKRFFSKKLAIAGGVAFTALAAPAAALALGVGQPQLGDVEASFSLNLSAAPTINFCTSPSGTSFVQRGFKWKGSMTDANPSGHIYPLNGVLSITGNFTINGTTGEGVGNGFITLTTNTGSKIFQGSFELPTQVVSPQTGSAVARGMVDVPLFTNNSPNGSQLIANIEASLDGNTGALTGFMGKTIASPAVPDISMEFNEKTCS
jgi:hypothetical protein